MLFKASTQSDVKSEIRKLNSALTGPEVHEKASLTSVGGMGQVDDETMAEKEEDECDEEDFELYFKDPQQLLDIFLELEEQNLSLIQNSQDTEEALEEMKQTINRTKIKMERETEMLKRQIDALNEEIRKEQERESELKIKASYFNYGEFKSEEQDKMLKELNKKVNNSHS